MPRTWSDLSFPAFIQFKTKEKPRGQSAGAFLFDCQSVGAIGDIQLYRNASAGLAPVRSEPVASYPALPFNTLFSRESPEAIPAKIGAWVAVILVACHLYPRSGTSPTEDFSDKAHVCGTIKLYDLPTPVECFLRFT